MSKIKDNGADQQWPKPTFQEEPFLEESAITYHFIDQAAISHSHDQQITHSSVKGHALQWRFINSKKPQIHYRKAEKGTVNYFSKDQRISGLKRHQEVYYKGVYPKIDYRIYPYGDGLKYDWVVEPSGNPNKIRMQLEGVENVRLEQGRLHIKTSVNEVIEERPYAYQIIDGIKKEIACFFVWKNATLSFKFPEGYDKTKELVIDPELIFSSYSGSSANNFGYTATYDDYGFLYAGGTAFDIGYPTTLGAYSTSYSNVAGGTDIVLSKYDTSGTFLVYSTYLGGSGDEVRIV